MAALFQNQQWAVTKFGIEARKPEAPYLVEAARLLEITDRGDGPMYDWPVHMAEKSWVSIEAFIEAYTKALDLHRGRYDGAVDQTMLASSLKTAREEARQK